MDKRYYINETVTIDLENVVGIVILGKVLGAGQSGYSYEVVFKNGTKIRCIGYELKSQFAEYKGIAESNNKSN